MAVAQLTLGFSANPLRWRVSADGYLRMTPAEFASVPLIHLLTRLHDDRPDDELRQTCISSICGYTEWVSATAPAITLSWDWVLGAERGQAQCRRDGLPFGNVMLVCPQRRDLGEQHTTRLLGDRVDALAWQRPALEGLRQVYGGETCQF